MKSCRLAAIAALLILGCSKKADPKVDPKRQSESENSGKAASTVVKLVEPQTMVLRQVLVEIGNGADSYDLESTELAKQLGARLLASGWIVAEESQVPTGHRPRRVEALISLNYDITPAIAEAKGTIVVAMEANLVFIEDRSELQPRAALVVEKTLEASESEAVATELALLCQAALESLAESLVARERLRLASHAELLSLLSVGSDDAGLRIWALQLAADRSLREAVPAGIAALSHADENVQAAAIALLVELGDERAISALNKDIDFKDYEKLRVVIEAVSAIGGDDAVAFLEFVASGHPDADMRARAKQSIDVARRTRVAP